MTRARSKDEELDLMQKKESALGFDVYNQSPTFQRLRDALNERRYTVGETPISYRVISHWADNALLPEGIKDGNGWKKFNFVEMVWLHAANQMREFGLSLPKIASIRSSIMHWDKKYQRYPSFEYFIAEALESSADPYIVFLADNHPMLARAEQLQQQKVLFGSQHMLLISIKNILNLLNDKTLKEATGNDYVKDADALFHLSYEEKNLLGRLRSDEAREIKTKTKRGVITEIETATDVKGSTSYNTAGQEMRKKGAYGRVVAEFEDGVIKSVKKTERKRFDE